MYISSHRGPAPFLAMGFLVVAAATAAVLRGNLELKDCVRELLIYSKKKLLITTTAEVSSSSLSNNSKKSRRATLPSSRSSSSSTTTTTAEGDDDDGALVVKPIGTIRSIYRLCVGTPRQGLLAPHARGRIELTADNASDMVDSLEKFSHVWIVFVFHLNTSGNRKITKIAPPALGGKKVGVLATRSPHRGNPIGMTLCKLDSIMTSSSSSSSSTKGGKQKSTVILNISGLDLVDGTPVLDIKPYVPHYDSVPSANLQLPSWVSGGLATKRPVKVKDTAQKQLLDILKLDPFALDFYGPHRGDEGIMDTMTCVLACITQVLSVDVRSNWQTKKARVGKSQAERASRVQQQHDASRTSSSGEATAETTTTNKLCSQQLDNLLIQYSVDQPEETNRETSEGSGAEDVVVVHSLQLWLKPRDNNNNNNNTSKDNNNNNNKNKSGRRHQATPVKSDRHIKEASNSTKKKQQQQEYDEQQQQQYDAIQSEAQADIEADLPKSTEIKISPSPPEMGADFPVVQHYWDEAAIVNTPGGVSPVISATRQHVGAGLRRSLSHSQLPFARLRMHQSPLLHAIRRQTSDGNLANRQE